MLRRCSLILLLAVVSCVRTPPSVPEEASAGSGSAGSAPPADWTLEQFQAFLRTATKVELVFDQGYADDQTQADHPRDKTILEKRDEVNEFCSDIKLVPKLACKCEHGQMMVFWNQSHKLEVSICDHCFDIMFEDRAINCKMPQSIYERYRKIEAYHVKTKKQDSQPASSG